LKIKKPKNPKNLTFQIFRFYKKPKQPGALSMDPSARVSYGQLFDINFKAYAYSHAFFHYDQN